MKPHEQQLRDEMKTGHPFTLVTASGERVKVRSHDHINLPPLEDEDGQPLTDTQRADFFQVWGNGQRYRWVAFNALNIIEGQAPVLTE
jgi:hypothetical protein